MAVILRCCDRWGREITLTDGCWNDHIVREHPILRDRLTAVEAVLTNPFRITQDVTYGNREHFYRHRVLPNLGKWYLKVCVEFMPTGPDGAMVGEVVTAFVVQHIKVRETELWP